MWYRLTIHSKKQIVQKERIYFKVVEFSLQTHDVFIIFTYSMLKDIPHRGGILVDHRKNNNLPSSISLATPRPPAVHKHQHPPYLSINWWVRCNWDENLNNHSLRMTTPKSIYSANREKSHASVLNYTSIYTICNRISRNRLEIPWFVFHETGTHSYLLLFVIRLAQQLFWQKARNGSNLRSNEAIWSWLNYL